VCRQSLPEVDHGRRERSEGLEKLEETFERVTNARVIQLSTKLTTLKLKAKQPIAEYLAEIRDVTLIPPS
jgi:hypothetical protein